MSEYKRGPWTLSTEHDGERLQAYLEHDSGESCSLACAMGTGETSGTSEMPIPPDVVAWAEGLALKEGY